MNEDLDKKLINTYPEIFKDRYNHHSMTCMDRGVDIGDGWYKLVDEICNEMMRIKYETGIQYIAIQVKEKFNVLRFYFKDDCRLLKISDKTRKKFNDKMQSFVNDIEIKSEVICEICGTEIAVMTECNKCIKNETL